MTGEAAIRDRAAELRVALSDEAAFESWYRRVLPRVYSYLMSRTGGDIVLAEELTQETFIAAVKQRSRFDGRADTVTWLCGIARHKLADHFRAAERVERRRMRIEVRQMDMGAGGGELIRVEDRAIIADVFRSLPAGQRAVLALVVLDDLPVAEAARLLGKSRAATESLLFRARDTFRRVYALENRDD